MKQTAWRLTLMSLILFLAPAWASGSSTAATVSAAVSTADAETVAAPESPLVSSITRFAVVGDSGMGNEAESQVARLVASWDPDFIIHTGDAYYGYAGGEDTGRYDLTVGRVYCAYLKDVTTIGKNCPQGLADRNRFFPTLGNHDYWEVGLDVYLKYFELPGAGFESSSGNERYYDFTWGPVRFFSLNSNEAEPAGVTVDSEQARWLRTSLGASNAPWNLVYFHHPPYSSGLPYGSWTKLRWPFSEWGASAVLSGHEHVYERVLADGIPYFTNGLGGGPLYTFGETPVPGSAVRFAGTWGAQLVTASARQITFEFYSIDGQLVDRYSLTKPGGSGSLTIDLPMIFAP